MSMYNNPGDENEKISSTDENSGEIDSDIEKHEEKKPLSEKIHDALQDWSNKDQADQNFDDTRP